MRNKSIGWALGNSVGIRDSRMRCRRFTVLTICSNSDNSVEMEELLRGSSMTQDELRAGKKLVHVIVRKSPLTKLDEKEPPKSKSATMTPSIAFRQGEAETISRVLDQVDKTAAKRMQEGLTLPGAY